jgi:DNA-binding MarR family transcriptional regulator
MQPELAFEMIREVLATADTFLRESQRLFRPHGLTAAQYNVLNLLASSDGGMSQREIGDVLVVDRSNVTGLVDRMEKAGWVRRATHPTDARAHQVKLTTTGRRLFNKVQPSYHAVIGQVTHGASDTQARNALTLLKSLQAGAVGWRLPEA